MNEIPHQVAARFLATWNAEHPTELGERLEGWNPGARYCDPLMQVEGREPIARMIQAVRARFPGYDFTLEGVPDGHGPFVRFSWTLARTGGQAAARGTDIIRIDDDGRILEVIGFLDGTWP